jgi:hypothetical protein
MLIHPPNGHKIRKKEMHLKLDAELAYLNQHNRLFPFLISRF